MMMAFDGILCTYRFNYSTSFYKSVKKSFIIDRFRGEGDIHILLFQESVVIKKQNHE